MATIAKRYFEGTAKDGSAASYGYEVAEDEQHNLVCLACGAPCEYHPTDMGREGIWVAVRCKHCDLNSEYESGGLLDACYEEDGYRGECLLCGSSLKWSGTTGEWHCADCGAECEIGKRLPKGKGEFVTAGVAANFGFVYRDYFDYVSEATLPDRRRIILVSDNRGVCEDYEVKIATHCGTDAAKAAALANAELAKHGLPLISVDDIDPLEAPA